jgi:dolichol-phosphate mannosyltransferase
MKNIAIATPTYNEAKNIKKLIPAIAKICKEFPKLSFTVLVIDDNSPDGTADVAEAVGKKTKVKNLSVRVLRRKGKEGFGKAYVHGFNELLKEKFDYIIQMDADLSHDPKYLKQFLSEAEAGHDFIAASRYVKGGGTPDWGMHRKVLSRGGNLYTRAFLGSQITDYTGGYNMYSTKLLKKINTKTLQAGGYGFLIELKYRALQESNSHSQVAIIFKDRQHGKSKIPRSTLINNFILVPKLRRQNKK